MARRAQLTSYFAGYAGIYEFREQQKQSLGASFKRSQRRRRDAGLPEIYRASSYRYSTNDIAAPSKPRIAGFVDSMT